MDSDRRLEKYFLVLTLGAAVTCTRFPGGTESGAVTGRWGGPRADLTFTETGGTIEYDCAHGGIGSAVYADRAGRFDVNGAHVREHGGPALIGERPDSLPARYVGRVSGDHMTLRVFVAADTLGPFDLARDKAAQLVKCL